MVDKNIKKVRILKKDLPNYIGNNDELFYQMRYRIVSEDKNRSSHWSPIYKLNSTSTYDEVGFDINDTSTTNIPHSISVDEINKISSITWTMPALVISNPTAEQKILQDKQASIKSFDVYVQWKINENWGDWTWVGTSQSTQHSTKYTASETASISATGGTETTYSSGGVDYKVHSFTNVGDTTFNVFSGSSDVDYFILAGGGGGGGSNNDTGGGGGGAGGYLTGSFVNLSTGAYTITVGGGGSAGSRYSTQAGNGGNSVFNGQTAIGGGGGKVGTGTGSNGGSGGGPGGTGTAGQGYSSPGSRGENRGGRGGGGAGSEPDAIGDNRFAAGSTGGAPINNSLRTGSAVAYAGGGGGGNGINSPVNGGLGGNGGGGGAGNGDTGSGAGAGADNSGGGGGGQRDLGEGGQVAAAGGSGIVVIRYATNQNVTVTGPTHIKFRIQKVTQVKQAFDAATYLISAEQAL